MSKLGHQLATKIILTRPHLTEKSAALATPGPGQEKRGPVYTFQVAADATRVAIKAAALALYKVKPIKVNMMQAPGKKIFQRGRVGRRPGFKKALVYLKVGDKIDFA